jgi:hypothetical protein
MPPCDVVNPIHAPRPAAMGAIRFSAERPPFPRRLRASRQ